MTSPGRQRGAADTGTRWWYLGQGHVEGVPSGLEWGGGMVEDPEPDPGHVASVRKTPQHMSSPGFVFRQTRTSQGRRPPLILPLVQRRG